MSPEILADQCCQLGGFPTELGMFRLVPRDKISSCGLWFWGLLLVHMPLFGRVSKVVFLLHVLH